MNGKLVGINTMIFSQSGGSVGIGFAIPSNLVRFYADNAVAGRKVERPWLGAQMETVTREMASTLGLERVSGAVITRLTSNGPASKAGMQLGDVIVNVDGFEVGDSHSVLYRLTTRGIGNKTKLDVIRNRKHVAIEVALLPAPKPGKDDVRNLSGNHPFDGARVSNILPSVADELNLDETDGVVIVAVRSGGVASRLDFQPGDIIVQIGDDKITDVIMLDEITRKPQGRWSVTIKRGGRLMKLQMSG
jgi:S1-C subfamily serine protease